jgi:hypothetical protein
VADVRIAPNVVLSDGATLSQLASVDASGRLSVNLTASSATVTVDSELPAAAALSDNFANPTAPGVGAFNMVWDGSTWDRAPGTSTDGLLVNLGTNNDVTVTSGSITADTELPAAAALADNTSNPTVPAVGAFGMLFDGSTWDRAPGTSAGGAFVSGPIAHDAAITGTGVNAQLVGGRASTAVPTAVSADGDAVWAWLDRRGAQKMVLVDDAGDSVMDGTNNAVNVNVVAGASGGVTHTDDAAFAVGTDDGVPAFYLADESGTDPVDEGDAGLARMDVNRRVLVRVVGATDANRMDIDASGRPTVNVNGTVTVDSELPTAAALADAASNPTAPATGAFLMGYNGATWDRVRTANTGRLQVDIVSGGGSDTPTNPVNNYDTTASVAAGSGDNHDTADLGGTTKKVAKVIFGASVPLKAELQAVVNGSVTDTFAVGFSPPGGIGELVPSHRDYFSKAFSANAGFDGFRLVRTNLDASEAADVYSTIEYED